MSIRTTLFRCAPFVAVVVTVVAAIIVSFVYHTRSYHLPLQLPLLQVWIFRLGYYNASGAILVGKVSYPGSHPISHRRLSCLMSVTPADPDAHISHLSLSNPLKLISRYLPTLLINIQHRYKSHRQPPCLYEPSSRLVDCDHWSISAQVLLTHPFIPHPSIVLSISFP